MFGLFKKRQPTERKSSGLQIDYGQYARNSWPENTSGVMVNNHTALQVTTVLACVRLIAQDVASLPLHVYRKEGDRNVRQDDDAIDRMLFRQPNDWQTAAEFKAQLTMHALLSGDGVALINRGRSGRPLGLLPIMPEFWSLERDGSKLIYTISDAHGRILGRFGQADILHIRGLTYDGECGLSIVRKTREAIGLAAALEGMQSRQMGNGARPQGLLTTDANLDPETVKRIAESWRQATTGENQFRTPVLDGGFKFNPITMTSVDGQVAETRKHQIVEICAAFGVAPAVLGLDDKTQAFASVEAMQRWHISHTLRPWLDIWEQAIDRALLDGNGPLFARFDTREMEKASTKERAESYRTLVELGIMTRNEAREMEGLPPLPGGDEPLVPLNMQEGQGDEAA